MTDREILLQFASVLVPELKAVSGRFADSISAEATNEQLEITASPYIRVLIDGRGPTRAGAKKGNPTLQQIILKWIGEKSITPKADSEGKIPTVEQLSWMISKSIHKSGTKLYQRGGGNRIFDSIITDSRINGLMAMLGTNYQAQIVSIVMKEAND